MHADIGGEGKADAAGERGKQHGIVHLAAIGLAMLDRVHGAGGSAVHEADAEGHHRGEGGDAQPADIHLRPEHAEDAARGERCARQGEAPCEDRRPGVITLFHPPKIARAGS